jgi:flagellar protein FliO/FliZ
LKTTDPIRAAHSGRIARALAGLLCGATHAIYAASSAPFAAPAEVATSHSTTGLLRVVIALLVVLGAVVAAGRLARRVRGVSGGAGSALQVLGQLSLGARERAVLIRVGERQLLIGVAPGHVRTLHVFDEMLLPQATDSAPAADSNRPSFKALLLKSLGK